MWYVCLPTNNQKEKESKEREKEKLYNSFWHFCLLYYHFLSHIVTSWVKHCSHSAGVRFENNNSKFRSICCQHCLIVQNQVSEKSLQIATLINAGLENVKVGVNKSAISESWEVAGINKFTWDVVFLIGTWITKATFWINSVTCILQSLIRKHIVVQKSSARLETYIVWPQKFYERPQFEEHLFWMQPRQMYCRAKPVSNILKI